MMRKIVIGVMGPSDNATAADLNNAYQLGKLIATAGWVLLTGGRKAGVMDAANNGAKAGGGLTIGILPGNNTSHLSDAVDIAIVTDMGNARNNINVLSSDVIIACGIGTGTASEIALALKATKTVILLTNHPETQQFFTNLAKDHVFLVTSPDAAMQVVQDTLRQQYRGI